MAEVLMPEKRGGISGLASLFTQGMGMLKQGSEGYEAYKGFRGSGGGGDGGGGGLGAVGGAGAAGKYSLGVGNVTPVSEGMSPTLGGGEAAGSGSSGGLSSYAPYAGPVIAGYAEYRAMKNPSLRDKLVGHRDVSYQGAGWTKATSPMMNKATKQTGGLALTADQPDQMSAIERRYNTRQTAMADIDAAQKALGQAGLSMQDRRSISQKLAQAKIAAGGPKRGATGIA